jgi:hypothetical protein
VPATLSRFGNLSSSFLSLLTRTCQLAVSRTVGPFHRAFRSTVADLGKTAAESAFRDHWQRNFHACSERTFAYLASLHNRNLFRHCAKTVEEESCLWKLAENTDKMREPEKRGIGNPLNRWRIKTSTANSRRNRIRLVAISLLHAGSIRRIAEGHWRTS